MARLPCEVVTPRLLLRLWQAEDASALRVAIERSLEHLQPWMAWISLEPLSDEDRVQFIHSSRTDWENGGDAIFGAFHDGVIVGGCGLHRRQGQGILDIGYWIHAGHVRNGYATELTGGLTSAAFEVEGIERVEIHHDKANVRSRAVRRSLGFVQGPEEPDDVDAPGEVGIDCAWSIERSGWKARRPSRDFLVRWSGDLPE